MMGKVAVAGVSLILVVGVIVGVVATVHQRNSNNSPDDNMSSQKLVTGMKAVDALCAPTVYNDVCFKTLTPLAQKNESITALDLVRATFEVALEQVRKAFDDTGNLKNSTKEPRKKARLEDCQELFDYATDELQASISSVGDPELHTVNDRVDDIKSWLSAVISYKETCLDGFDDIPKMKPSMTNGLVNVTQMTSNALSVVVGISDIVKAFDVSAQQTNKPNRRLLNFRSTKQIKPKRRLLNFEVDNHGYPKWFSAADRKLLANQAAGNIQPIAVVALDGSGQFKTIGAALAAYPKTLQGKYVIYVKAGIYNEYITVDKTMKNIFMYGDGPRATIVTGSKSNTQGFGTWKSASFSVIGTNFIAKSMGFQNTAGPQGHQAVALRVQSDMSAFFNCRMDGYQDTLYVQALRQFYRNCVISGTVDFIFGDSSTLIQNSLIIVRLPMANQQNTVTAQGRTEVNEPTGVVLQNCRIVPDQKLFPQRLTIPTYLGRPWKQYSRTVIMESALGDLIQPAGWMPWQGNFALNTLYYAEYGNTGPGANTAQRVKWPGFHVINRIDALQFTAGPFLQSNMWLPGTGIPFITGLLN